MKHISIAFIILVGISTFSCSAQSKCLLRTELLPEASPKLIVLDRSDQDEDDMEKSYKFKNLEVHPQVNEESYCIPNSLLQAIQWFDEMLPHKFRNALELYYGVSQSKDIELFEVDSVEERLVDLDEYIVEIWKLNTETKLARDFQCLGIFENNLHNFYLVWAAQKASNPNIKLDSDVRSEYELLKSRLRTSCEITI